MLPGRLDLGMHILCFLFYRVVTLAGSDQWMTVGGDPEKVRLRREEDLYRQEMLKLDKDLTYVGLLLPLPFPFSSFGCS